MRGPTCESVVTIRVGCDESRVAATPPTTSPANAPPATPAEERFAASSAGSPTSSTEP